MSTLNLQATTVSMSMSNSIGEGGCVVRPPVPEPLPFPRPFPGGGSEFRGDGRMAVENRQIERIKNGLKDGSLSESEAQGLLAKESAIAQRISAARADGYVSPSEKREIASMQREASRDIFAARHNDVRGNPNANSEIVNRQVNQLDRIQDGIRSGQLTSGETSKLLGEQSAIAGVASFAGDGALGGLAKFVTGMMQDGASRDIFNEKHDAEQALPRPFPIPFPVPLPMPWMGKL